LHLPGVIPLVHSAADVQTLIALQTNQARAQHGRQYLDDFGLADAWFAFQKQGSAQPEGQVQAGGQPSFRDVMVRFERLKGVIN
jgi:hypothetical protein